MNLLYKNTGRYTIEISFELTRFLFGGSMTRWIRRDEEMHNAYYINFAWLAIGIWERT